MIISFLHDEVNLYGDSGYIGAEKRQNAIVRNKQGKKIRYKQNRKPTRIKKLSASGQRRAKKAEHQKSSVRAKVEHVFAVIKGQFRYRKTRYRGLPNWICCSRWRTWFWLTGAARQSDLVRPVRTGTRGFYAVCQRLASPSCFPVITRGCLKSAFGIGQGGKTGSRVWFKETGLSTVFSNFLNNMFGI